MIADLESAGVRIMTRTTAFGLYDYSVAGLLERVTDHLPMPDPHMPRQRFWTIRRQTNHFSDGSDGTAGRIW